MPRRQDISHDPNEAIVPLINLERVIRPSRTQFVIHYSTMKSIEILQGSSQSSQTWVFKQNPSSVKICLLLQDIKKKTRATSYDLLAYIWTNPKSSETIFFGLIRPRYRILVIMHSAMFGKNLFYTADLY